MTPLQIVTLDSHLKRFQHIKTYSGRWQASLVKAALFSTGFSFIKACEKQGIFDPGLRIHGASAVTVWYKDGSRRFWVMPSTVAFYQQMAKQFNLEEIVDEFYGPYLLYKIKGSQARILLPDEEIEPEFVKVVDEQYERSVLVASLKELERYYSKRGLVQKGMYKKVMRPYGRS